MNNLEIGKKIKYLRKGKGITQEVLASYLGVTTQAVSKWENESTAPDIALLPSISIYFGVTIDELFSIADEARLERIDNMISDIRYMTNDEFTNSEVFLKEFIDNHRISKELKVKALEVLSWLYIKRAEEYKNMAGEYAKEGIELSPLSSTLHKALNNSHITPIGDWNVMNHSERIDYYKNFIEKHPSHRTGYMWILDALIDDGRFEEARVYHEKYEKIDKDNWRIMYYKGLIEFKDGNKTLGKEIFDEMAKKYNDIEGPYFDKAKIHAYEGEWHEAIHCFERDFELSKKPRYIDNLDAIAKIYEILGDKNKAIETYERYIELLKEEWDIIEGELVDCPKREIERLSTIRS